jgi:tRNA (guanine26-N2/guanine27-N2)-dimethyltransferase
MNINRDLAILFITSYFAPSKLLHLCDPMTGSGVRAARYLLETPNVAHVVAADRGHEATKLASKTIKINGLENETTIVETDAHKLLSTHLKDRFDLIDLDPFGSPSPFFESALRATNSGGIIAATATDMGPLSGARTVACLRKYGVWSLRTEFEKETAVRTLASCLLSTAARMELGIEIVFSHTTDHYTRIYAVVTKGRKAANQALKNIGFVTYCPSCLLRNETRWSTIKHKCANCGATTSVGGPYWLGQLWDRRTVVSMIQHTPALATTRLSEVQKILDLIHDELDSPKFYYTTEALSSAYGLKPLSVAVLIELLRKEGHKATRTHFNPTGFRTDASLEAIIASFRYIAEKAQA